MTQVKESNATRSLRDDHENVLANLNRLDKSLQALATDTNSDVRGAKRALAQAVDFLQQELELHLRKEEEALFPPLEAIIGAMGGPTAVMRAEHQSLRTKNGELQTLVKELPSGDDKLSAEASRQLKGVADYIITLLRDHIHKENFILFPMSNQMLSGATLDSTWESMRRLDHEAKG